VSGFSLSAVRRRLGPFAMPAIYLAFTLAVWWRLWTPIDGARQTWKYDPQHTYWGDQVFWHQTAADGHLALWNPYDRGGAPAYVEPDAGMLYPPNWLSTLYGLVTGSVPYTAIVVKIVVHWVFGVIGMHLFLRRLRAREPACYASGFLFGWACPAIRYNGSTLNWGFAWIPWVLLALHWFCERPSARRAVVLGTTAAMLLLAGSPTVLLYMIVITVPYGLYLLRGRIRASIKYVAAAAGVFFLWVGPMVVSNAQHLEHSVRASRDLDFIAGTVFSAATFISFLVPDLGGENIYYGILPILLIGILVSSSGRTQALVFLGIAAFGVALALGKNAGFMPAISSALAPFSLFRHAHRYLYVTTAAVAVLTGLGLNHVLSESDPARKQALARRVAWIGGAVTLALGIGYVVSVVVSDRLWSPKNTSFGHATMAAAIGTALLRAVLVTDGRRQQVYTWIAVASIPLSLWAANAKSIDWGFDRPVVMDKDDLVAELADLETEWRVYDRSYLHMRPGTRLRIRDFGGYEDYPIGLGRYRVLLDAAHRNLTLLGHANVRYYLDGNRPPPVKPRPADRMNTLKAGVHELPDVAPAVMYVPAPVLVETPREAVRRLAGITPGQGAVVEGPPPPAGPPDAPVTAGRITLLEPNRVVAEIDAPGPGLVVIAEAYYPAWKATLNGEPVTMQPANVMFRGVPVPAAGHYRIEMWLRPLHFWLMIPGYLAAFPLFFWCVWSLRRRPDAEDA
jgi:hypothetical protein